MRRSTDANSQHPYDLFTTSSLLWPIFVGMQTNVIRRKEMVVSLPERTSLSPAESVRAAPPRLSRQDLRAAQRGTLNEPRARYGFVSRLLFGFINVVYGRGGSLLKFRVLELLARVPYQIWERAAYRAVTKRSRRTGVAQRIYRAMVESRAQQDNEQWHLFVLDEIIQRKDLRALWFRHRVLPRVLAGLYHPMCWLLFVVNPAASYRLNASFEDHAEHEYMHYVAEHPELDNELFRSELHDVFGHVATIADILRQIGHDERVHKLDSLLEADRQSSTRRGTEPVVHSRQVTSLPCIPCFPETEVPPC